MLLEFGRKDRFKNSSVHCGAFCQKEMVMTDAPFRRYRSSKVTNFGGIPNPPLGTQLENAFSLHISNFKNMLLLI